MEFILWVYLTVAPSVSVFVLLVSSAYSDKLAVRCVASSQWDVMQVLNLDKCTGRTKSNRAGSFGIVVECPTFHTVAQVTCYTCEPRCFKFPSLVFRMSCNKPNHKVSYKYDITNCIGCDITILLQIIKEWFSVIFWLTYSAHMVEWR